MTLITSPRDENLEDVKALLREDAARQVRGIEEVRRGFDAKFTPLPVPPGCMIKPIANGEQITPTCGETGKAMLYHHGGGFTVGSRNSHRHFVARLAEGCGIVAFNMDYRLAPEHPYPAALDDAVANYEAILAKGFAPSDIVVAGESAGGNLTAALLLRLRDAGMPMPAGAYLLSPWLDLALRGASYQENGDSDPLFFQAAAKAYARGTPLDQALVSPLYADLTGLPPLLLQVSSDELMLSDSTDFARKAEAAGVAVTLQVWQNTVHAWPFLHAQLPLVAQAAIDYVAAWVRPVVRA
ncbi:alpha/beta hydrolase [Roseiterribacter gracilis]|uniref:Alpha/beta hydrolase fold-3 domain-containing protein n=1 Tax=Roseiterribacter gracilis TaxID=2812848 RepID=A0A8S8XB33_9PROT|nr:hypothetical protein TMPK1_06970 [Rhodospirillales bacterium TMPK1]